MSYLYVVLALVLLVVLHELGHFLAARAVGIRATKFYVFFPPALFKRTVGGVEYGIGAIPAGGFVKLPGMFEPEPGEVAERLRIDYESLMPLVREGDVRLRLDAARREIAHVDSADGLTAPLEEVRAGIASARLDARDDGERATFDRLDARVAGMLDDAHPRAYWRAALWRRMAVIFAGPLVNLVVAFVVLVAFWWFLSPSYEIDDHVNLAQVTTGSPAERAGLDTKSEVTAWNGPVDGLTIGEYDQRIRENRGKPITVTWREGDTTTTRTIFPEYSKADDAALIGVLPGLESVRITGREHTSAGFAARQALDDMRRITVGNLEGLSKVFFDREVRKEVGSVVGIVQVAEDVDQAGRTIQYVAIISLVLAVMNLLPLLPLDGGHLLFGVLEAIRRRPMPRAAFERYSLVGLALVLVLFFIGLDNDIGRARG